VIYEFRGLVKIREKSLYPNIYIMSPNEWGPPVWTFFHVLAANIREDSYKLVGPQIFMLISKIARYLPCPDCSEHAAQFLAKIGPPAYATKTDLQRMLYVFHNVVNKRKNKSMPGPEILESYQNMNMIDVYNKFIAVYNTRGNMKLLADSFQRQLIITDVKRWMTKYARAFM
jgi:hypothetical protein